MGHRNPQVVTTVCAKWGCEEKSIMLWYCVLRLAFIVQHGDNPEHRTEIPRIATIGRLLVSDLINEWLERLHRYEHELKEAADGNRGRSE